MAKIDNGGTPIWVYPQRTGGVEITQGRSRIKQSRDDVHGLAQILNELTRGAQAGKKITARTRQRCNR